MNIISATIKSTALPPAQLIDEDERLATFAASAATRAGQTADYNVYHPCKGAPRPAEYPGSKFLNPNGSKK